MKDMTLSDALATYSNMDSALADDVARRYLMNVLDADLPQDVVLKWGSGPANTAQREDVEKRLKEIESAQQQSALLRTGVQAALGSRPETATKFVEAVESAGQDMFVMELTAVALAAAMLIREYGKGGKKWEEETTVTDPKTGVVTHVKRVVYDDAGPFAKLLTLLLPGK